MEYYNEDSLIKYFQDEINRISSQKIVALQKEIAIKKQDELNKLSIEVKHQVGLSLGVELKDMRDQYRQDINNLLSKNAQVLFELRKSISEDIFTAIENKLLSFVKSDDYSKLLVTKLKNIVDVMTNQNLSFYVRSDDQICKEIIRKQFDNSTKIIDDNDIKIGGFYVINTKLMLEIDETLDTKIENNKSWFYSNSKIFIKN